MASELEKALKTIMTPGFGETEASKTPGPKLPWTVPFDPTELAHQMRLIGYHAWKLAIMATTAPEGQRKFARMQAPVPGDLVVEVTTIRQPERTLSSVGTLLRITREPVLDAEGNPIDDRTEEVSYIRNFAGEEERWTNALMVALPVWHPDE